MPLILPAQSLCIPLVSLADFKQWKDSGALDAADTPDDESLIERALCAATAWIESVQGCNRSFTLETGVTKVFRPWMNGRVEVPDLVAVTSVALDTNDNRTYATTLTTSDYDLYPYGVQERYQEIRSRGNASRSILAGQFVQVVGDFGYTINGQVPAMIQQACLILTARYFVRRQSPYGVLQAPEIGRFANLPRIDPDVEELIAPFRRGNDWVLVM